VTRESSRNRFQVGFDVSRETMGRLDVYERLLRKWNPTINLVSKASLEDLWQRHFFDSLQILGLVHANSGNWIDFGSGGGFPGMVVAIVAAEQKPGLRFTLVESDLRKSTFLRTVSRETNVSATVLSERIENMEPLGADVVSARALAPLTKLLGYAQTHLGPQGQALFMKGANYRLELEEALETWSFQSEEYKSKTDEAAAILRFGDIRRV